MNRTDVHSSYWAALLDSIHTPNRITSLVLTAPFCAHGQLTYPAWMSDTHLEFNMSPQRTLISSRNCLPPGVSCFSGGHQHLLNDSDPKLGRHPQVLSAPQTPFDPPANLEVSSPKRHRGCEPSTSFLGWQSSPPVGLPVCIPPRYTSCRMASELSGVVQRTPWFQLSTGFSARRLHGPPPRWFYGCVTRAVVLRRPRGWFGALLSLAWKPWEFLKKGSHISLSHQAPWSRELVCLHNTNSLFLWPYLLSLSFLLRLPQQHRSPCCSSNPPGLFPYQRYRLTWLFGLKHYSSRSVHSSLFPIIQVLASMPDPWKAFLEWSRPSWRSTFLTPGYILSHYPALLSA